MANADAAATAILQSPGRIYSPEGANRNGGGRIGSTVAARKQTPRAAVALRPDLQTRPALWSRGWRYSYTIIYKENRIYHTRPPSK